MIKTNTKLTVSAILFVAICMAAAGTSASAEAPWYGIIPPLLAIMAAFVTKNVMLSLGGAILMGGLLKQVVPDALSLSAWIAGLGQAWEFVWVAVRPWVPASSPAEGGHFSENWAILSFVFVIFAMVETILVAGGFDGVIRRLLRFVKGKRSAEFLTATLGVGCFIDDYANAIIVGSSVRPITDRFRVSREKLAFLVDATSAPISGLAVISTWIAYEVGLFGAVATDLGIDKNGYAMFFDALAFRFYCLLMILFVFLLILIGRDFGPMRRTLACDPSEGAAEANAAPSAGYARIALVPLLGMIFFHVLLLWWTGQGWAKLQAGQWATSWIYWREVISDVPNSSLVLVYSSSFGLALAVLMARVCDRLSIGRILGAMAAGARKGLFPSVILILAWSLKNCCDGLSTGDYLSSLLVGTVAPIWFPVLLFIVASITSFATGTSWGTMAILIPTAIPVAFALDGEAYGLITMISLGAVLDGAIFGDHCSPISDTTIISSLSCQCDLMQHVRTQLPYCIWVASLALACGYLPAALGMKWIWSILMALVPMAGVFWWARVRSVEA
ncbi:MAG: hypothetical protein IH892_12670 [Planctomycetes bacterium]|nr:hypothetical protein [Planctomycetota bacterium]